MQKNVRTERVSRREAEELYVLKAPQSQIKQPYPWEITYVGKHPKITKEFFRCMGSSAHPGIDCAGATRHSLPLRDGKEYIYPILIDLLNYVQEKTGKRVVVTSGHRCPVHNTYAEKENATSKHMIGAEVDFYVEGLENRPYEVVELLMQFFQDKKEFDTFSRYEKADARSTTAPWYNQEVFIQLFGKHEGRDLDNIHPYPYISIQVRYDRDKKERVIYTWKQAHQGYMRY